MVVDAAPIILHAHLFKNAGSSLDWALERCFGSAFLDHRDDEAMRGSPDHLRALIERRGELRALSSHWLPLPPPTAAGRVTFPVVLLRDPLERMRSVYAFERRQNVDHPGTRKAREASFRDYVAWRLEPRTGPVLRNYQMRMLSGAYPGPDDDAQEAAARAMLESFTVVGIVERFDETMVLIEAKLGDRFPGIDLAYVRQNSSADAPSDADSASEPVSLALRDLLGPARDANARDLALYEQANARFEAQWRALAGAEERLFRFRARCAALRGGVNLSRPA